MNTMPRLPLKPAAFCAALLFGFSFSAPALPPTFRHMTGVLEEVNQPTRTLIVQQSNSSNRRKLNWRERTRFVVDARFTGSTALHAGDAVVVTYRSPLFGEPFATKVVVNACAAKAKAARR